MELNADIRKMTSQLDGYESECRHYKDELKNLSRQLDSLESENERLRSRLLVANEKNNEDITIDDVGDDTNGEVDQVQKLKNEIKNYEMKASHTKIAINNLEKSISTYHDKLELLEGQNIEYRHCYQNNYNFSIKSTKMRSSKILVKKAI